MSHNIFYQCACSFKVYAVQEDFDLLVLFRFMVVIKKINVTAIKKRFSVDCYA